jgi:hypothetical protein
MHNAKRIWDIVREFCGDEYIAQAAGDGLVVRIYKGEAPDCLKCNDRKWIVGAREQKPGILLPIVKTCTACNPDGMEPPRMEKN